MKISLPFLAASAEVGQVQASWILQSVGLAGPAYNDFHAPPAELSVETFVLAKQSLEAMIKAVGEPTTMFTAFRLGVESAEAVADRKTRASVCETYGLSRIARRATLEEPLRRFNTEDQASVDAVRQTYERYSGSDSTAKPSDAAERRAQDLLGRIQADVN